MLRAVGSRGAKTKMLGILVPVLGRPERPRPLVESLEKAAPDAHLYFLANHGDVEEVRACRAIADEKPGWCSLLLVVDKRPSWAQKINDGIRRTREPWLLLCADDVKFYPRFLEAAARLMSDPGVGVIGTCDLGHRGTLEGWHSTHPIVSRKYVIEQGTADQKGVIAHEGYRHNFVDTEIVATAKKRGAYQHCRDCLIEHLHPLWGKGKSDATYRLGKKFMRKDAEIFWDRVKKFGWETKG